MEKRAFKVLIVDDDPHLLSTLGDILRARGFEVLTVPTGKAALTSVEREDIDVALIDLRLADLPGMEVLRGIKERSPDSECILLTGHASQEAAIQALNLGAYSFVLKPYDVDLVLLSITHAAEKRATAKALVESENRYQTFINATTDMAFLKDDQLRYILVNQANADFFGKPVEEIVGRDDVDLMGAAGANVCRTSDLRALQENCHVITVETVEGRTYETRKFPVPLQDGRRGVGGYVRDVTDKIRAEQAMQESEDHYRGLFEDSPISLWEEDFSQVKVCLEKLRKRGVKDFRAYFKSHPEKAAECISLIRIVDVNKATLKLYKARNKKHFLESIKISFWDDPESFTDELLHIAEGRTQFNWEGMNQTLDGERLDISLGWSVVPGHENDLSKVIISIVDLTERKQIEAQVMESEERYHRLFDDSPVALCEEDFSGVKQRLDALHRKGVKDIHTYLISHPDVVKECAASVRIVNANKATLALYHAKTRDEFLANLTLLLHEESYGYFLDELVFIWKGMTQFDWEGVNQTLDGMRIDVNMRWSVAPGYESDLSKVMVSLVDITERKRAENGLKESEEKFKTLFNSANDAIFTMNHTTFLDCNVTTEKVFKCSRDMIVGHSPVDFSPERQPDGKLSSKSAVEKIEAAFTGKPQFFEWVHTHLDGTPFDAEVSLNRVFIGREFILQAIVRDVTERKAAEEALKRSESSLHAVLQSTADGILAVSGGNEVLYFNERFAEMWRIPQEILKSKDDSVLLQHVLDQLSDPQDFLKKVQELYHSLEESFDILLFKDGRVFERLSRPLLQETGEQGRVWSFRDITERKVAEEALRQGEEQVRRLLNQQIAINQLAISLGEKMSLKEVYNTIHAHIQSLVDTWCFIVSSYDEKAAVIRAEYARSDQEYDVSEFPPLPLGKPGQGTQSQVIHSGKPYYTPDHQQAVRNSKKRYTIENNGSIHKELTDEKEKEDTTRSVVYLPMKVEGKTVGIMQVQSTRLDAYSKEDINLLEGIANIAAVAIQNTRLHEDLLYELGEREKAAEKIRRHVAELEILYENGLAVSRLLDPAKIGERIIAALEEHLAWHHVTIRLREGDSENLKLVAFNQPGLRKKDRTAVAARFNTFISRIGQGLSGWAAQTGEPVRAGNVREYPQYVDTYPGIQSGLYIPLKIGEHVTGCISIESEQADAFSEQDERLMVTLANQAAVAFENAHLYQTVQVELEERRQAEKALRESEERYRMVTDNTTDMVYLVDTNLKAVYISPSVARATGYTLEDIETAPLNQIMTSESFEAVIQATAEDLSAEKLEQPGLSITRDLNLEFVRKDGSTFITENTFVLIRDDQGRAVNILGTGRDITERKHAEDALRESQQRLQSILDNTSAQVFIKDLEGNYILANNALANIMGSTEEEIRGKNLRELIGVEEAEQHILNDKAVLASGLPGTFEETSTRQDGVHTYLSIKFPLRGDNDEIFAIGGISTDITEQKRAEEQLKLLSRAVEQSPASIVLTDPAGNIEYVNQRFTLVTGYKAEEVMGRNPNILKSGFTPEEEYENLWGRITAGDEWRGEFRNRRKNGDLFWESAWISPILDKNNQTTHFLAVKEDITARKGAELFLQRSKIELEEQVSKRTAELSAANAALAKATKLKDEFLASMSHELRTPLTGVLGLTEAMQRQVYGELNTRQAEILHTIEESGRHLLNLINDILDLSKIEAGRMDLEVAKLSVDDLCQASLRLVKQMAAGRHQTVAFDVKPAGLVMRADARRLKQVLFNLLGNAIKFTPENGELGLEVRGNPEEREIRFTVWDRGIGISEEDLERLFQPFVQLDSSLARSYPGTGLGLSLARRLVELHGGRIEVESTPGQGSRFIVIVPWLKSDTAPLTPIATETSASTNMPTVDKSRNSRYTILVADDNEVNIQLISDYLNSQGYQVVLSRDGFQALDAVDQGRPDMVLMDIQMPGMDGLEAIRRIRSLPDPKLAKLPVIAVTALVMPGDRERCLEAGANYYLTKPLNLGSLVEIIQLFLEKAR